MSRRHPDRPEGVMGRPEKYRDGEAILPRYTPKLRALEIHREARERREVARGPS